MPPGVTCTRWFPRASCVVASKNRRTGTTTLRTVTMQTPVVTNKVRIVTLAIVARASGSAPISVVTIESVMGASEIMDGLAGGFVAGAAGEAVFTGPTT